MNDVKNHLLIEIYRPLNMCHPTKHITAVISEQDETEAGVILDKSPTDDVS